MNYDTVILHIYIATIQIKTAWIGYIDIITTESISGGSKILLINTLKITIVICLYNVKLFIK